MKTLCACLLLFVLSSATHAHQLVIAVAWNGNQGYLAELDGGDPIHTIVLVQGLGQWRNGESYTTVGSGGAGFVIVDLDYPGPYKVTVAGTGMGAALHQPVVRNNVWTTQTPYIVLNNWAENPNWTGGIRRLMADVYRYWKPKIVDGLFVSEAD